MSSPGKGIRFSRVLPAVLVVMCVGVLGSAMYTPARASDTSTHWGWAQRVALWTEFGDPVEPVLRDDPADVRHGSVVEIDFMSMNGAVVCDDGGIPYVLEHGRDYTFVFYVFAEGGGMRSMNVAFARADDFKCVDCSGDGLMFAADGEWHKAYVHVEDFCGQDGEHLLWLCSGSPMPVWYLGDIRQHGGIGKYDW